VYTEHASCRINALDKFDFESDNKVFVFERLKAKYVSSQYAETL